MMKLASELGISQTGMTDIVAAAGEAGIGKRRMVRPTVMNCWSLPHRPQKWAWPMMFPQEKRGDFSHVAQRDGLNPRPSHAAGRLHQSDQ
ncbi:hypothetical protein PCI56_01330 [Plesiomonas shigelloides subsp. oncorhynchi]|nr:hypothetical protein [Plesiomonas shigelloides]